MFGKHLFNEAEYVKYVEKDRAHRLLLTWKFVIRVPSELFRALRCFLNMSMTKICPWFERTSIESKLHPRLPKHARQMKTLKEPEKPAPRKRKPHLLVLQRSLAQSHHLQRMLPHLPGQLMHRRGQSRQRRHPAQGDLMLGKQAVNRGAGTETTMAHAVMVKVAGTLVVQR